MASSSDNKMGYEERGSEMFNNNCSSGSGNIFGSGWDPIENHHQGLLNHYQSNCDLAPKLASFGSGGFSEMVNPFMNLNPETLNQIKNGDASGDSSEKIKGQDEKKQKTEHGMNSYSKGNNNNNNNNKQIGKQTKDSSDNSGGDYIHVRAKRGQATNSHSLAERVRRERISERMKLLQDLVPGCNKITGKAVMLDEIINYVQSLQHQVEFLSMKLATVNPELNIDIDRILSKEILNSRSNNSNLGFITGLNSSQHYHHPQGNLPVIPTTNPQFPPIHPQPVWDNDLHNLLQMGFDSNSGINNMGSKTANTRGF